MAQHQRDNKQVGKDQAMRASALVSHKKASQSYSAREDALKRAPRPDSKSSIAQFFMRNLLYILGVVAVIAVATLIIVILSPFVAESPDSQADEEASYVSPYDWTSLDRSDNRFAYTVDGQVKSRLGVDVSENQHQIDWDAVAHDGVDFAMVRLGYRGATEGALYLDERYWDNMDGVRDAGLDCGIYFFSQATTTDEAVEEAEFVLEYLGGISLEYPVAFDSEEKVAGVGNARTSGLDNEKMTEIADAFCARIEQAGYRTIVYGNAADLSRYKRSNLDEHHIWWAEYSVPVPTAKIDFSLWQYTNDGKVDGIDEPVDLNIDLSNALN